MLKFVINDFGFVIMTFGFPLRGFRIENLGFLIRDNELLGRFGRFGACFLPMLL